VLIEKSLTTEPKTIHPLNILAHRSTLMTINDKVISANDENSLASARGADNKRNNTFNN